MCVHACLPFVTSCFYANQVCVVELPFDGLCLVLFSNGNQVGWEWISLYGLLKGFIKKCIPILPDFHPEYLADTKW